jgi:hypothetical protein
LCDFFFAWQSLNNLPTPTGIVRIYGESRKWFGVNVDGTPMVEDALTGDCFELSEAFGLDDLPTLKEIEQFCEEVRKRRGPTNDEGSLGQAGALLVYGGDTLVPFLSSHPIYGPALAAVASIAINAARKWLEEAKKEAV